MSAATGARPAVDEAWRLLGGVPDPELPVLSVVDLGITRSVEVSADGRRVQVTITPTYSGCPALAAIEADIRRVLGERFAEVEVRSALAPAWTTDWLSADARRRLAASGIAPPNARASPPAGGRRLLPVLGAGRPVGCPRCDSADVERISEFGSTACKALYRCRHCREPFDYFKCH